MRMMDFFLFALFVHRERDCTRATDRTVFVSAVDGDFSCPLRPVHSAHPIAASRSLSFPPSVDSPFFCTRASLTFQRKEKQLEEIDGVLDFETN